MPPQPRKRTKLGRHPAGPSSEQHEPTEDEQYARGRAGTGRASAQVPGAQDPGSERTGAQVPEDGRTGDEGTGAREPKGERASARIPGAPDPEYGSRESEGERASPGQAEPGTRSPGGEQAATGRVVRWSPEAKAVRSALTAWAAARRKTTERATEAREAADRGQVSRSELAVIAERVAAASGEPLNEVHQALGVASTTAEEP